MNKKITVLLVTAIASMTRNTITVQILHWCSTEQTLTPI